MTWKLVCRVLCINDMYLFVFCLQSPTPQNGPKMTAMSAPGTGSFLVSTHLPNISLNYDLEVRIHYLIIEINILITRRLRKSRITKLFRKICYLTLALYTYQTLPCLALVHAACILVFDMRKVDLHEHVPSKFKWILFLWMDLGGSTDISLKWGISDRGRNKCVSVNYVHVCVSTHVIHSQNVYKIFRFWFCAQMINSIKLVNKSVRKCV